MEFDCIHLNVSASARQQSLLSDEQAKEVEQILSAAVPAVGVAVAAVVATATSPTGIKSLIEETQPTTESPPTAEHSDRTTTTTTTKVNTDSTGGEVRASASAGSNSITVTLVSADGEAYSREVEQANSANDAEHVDDEDEDEDEDEDVDIVGIGAAPAHILNATFTKADSYSAATNKANNNYNKINSNSSSNTNNNIHDDDEPEWLRDVLEAPNRSLENLLISRCSAGSDRRHSQDSQIGGVGESFVESKHSEVVTASKVETSYDADNDSTLFIQQSQQHQELQSPPSKQEQQQSQQSLLNQTFIQQDPSSPIPHGQTGESLQESIVSVESTLSDGTLNQTTTIDDSIISSKHNSTYSLAEGELHSINTNTTTTSLGGGELDESQFYIPEYPPVKSKEVYVESGVHYFEDGNFWMEVPGEFRLTQLFF